MTTEGPPRGSLRDPQRAAQRDLYKTLVKIFMPCQNEHRSTTRAIWHAQSAERVAWATSELTPGNNEGKVTRGLRFTRCCAHHELLTLKIWTTMFYLGFEHFFAEVSKALRPPQKMSLRRPKDRAPHKIIIVSQIKLTTEERRPV